MYIIYYALNNSNMRLNVIMLIGSWTFQKEYTIKKYTSIVMKTQRKNMICVNPPLYIVHHWGFLLLLRLYIFLDIWALCLSAVAKVWVSVRLWASTLKFFLICVLFIHSFNSKNCAFLWQTFSYFLFVERKIIARWWF